MRAPRTRPCRRQCLHRHDLGGCRAFRPSARRRSRRPSDEDLGGKGLNQAVAAARAGARVRLWAAVGTRRARRSASRSALGGRRDRHGHADRLRRPDRPVDDPGRRRRRQHDRQPRSTAPQPSTRCARAPSAGAIAPRRPRRHAGQSGAGGDRSLPRPRQGAGARTVLNPSPIARVAADALAPRRLGGPQPRRGRDLDREGRSRTQAARRLLAMGVGAVVVTLGAEGALLANAGEAHAVAAPGMPVVGTAGAGDVVCGSSPASSQPGCRPCAALGVAVAAASLSVSRPGTLSACPTRVEIAALRHSALVLR